MRLFQKFTNIFILLAVLGGIVFFSETALGVTQACKISGVCYGIGDAAPTINGIQGVGTITAAWLETFCNPQIDRVFETKEACEAGGIAYPSGACRCGNQCIKYGDSAAGGSVVTPGNCGPCTEKPSFEKCTEEVARESSSSTPLSKYADQLNKLKVDNVQDLIGIIVRGVMGVIGTVALVMMLYGGITWMTARGNSESTQKARDTILWAGLGIILIFASYALVDFVFEIFR